MDGRSRWSEMACVRTQSVPICHQYSEKLLQRREAGQRAPLSMRAIGGYFTPVSFANSVGLNPRRSRSFVCFTAIIYWLDPCLPQRKVETYLRHL